MKCLKLHCAVKNVKVNRTTDCQKINRKYFSKKPLKVLKINGYEISKILSKKSKNSNKSESWLWTPGVRFRQMSKEYKSRSIYPPTIIYINKPNLARFKRSYLVKPQHLINNINHTFWFSHRCMNLLCTCKVSETTILLKM